MNCRAAHPADILLLQSLAHRIWHACYPGIITPEQIKFMLGWMYSTEKITEEMAAGVVWEVVEEDGWAIGFLSFSLEPDQCVKLHKLYLLPEDQGRGLGGKLLAHIFDRARGLGGTEVWLQVNKGNERAVTAYRKAGFHVVREAVFEIGEGFVMDDYVMAKEVGEGGIGERKFQGGGR